jgi:uncharacterized membrane protein YccC
LPAPDLAAWRARLAARDPGNLALGRGLRAVIVGPILFAIALEVFDEPAFATMAIFGAVAALVFADFGGTPHERISAYLAAAAAGAVLLAAGTIVSDSTAWSVAVTFVAVVVIRFAGNFGPRWSAAVAPLILALTLGELVPAPDGAIPGRMVGWIVGVLCGAVAAITIMPTRASVRIEKVAADVARELAAVLRDALTASDPEARATLATRALVAGQGLRPATLMPVRPSGPGSTDVARRQVVDRLACLARILATELAEPPVALSHEMIQLGEAAADCLDASAGALDRTRAIGELAAPILACTDARGAALARVGVAVASDEAAGAVLARVDAGFIARAGAWHSLTVGRSVAFLAGDEALARGGEPTGDVPEPTVGTSWTRFDHFLGVYAIPTSVWFRGALRAGVALAAAVALARALGVDHAFWVALGTLSVLRSSALATGQSALAASLGTGIGFAVSSAVLIVLGLDDPALWAVLIVGVFLSGYLPQVGGFVAGQAAFTVFVVALFNLVDPVGWHTGLVRLEDVMLGAAVSAVVALVFWPRELEPLVARLVGEVSVAAGALLAASVDHLGRDGPFPDRGPAVEAEARARAALVELLDQFRRRPDRVEPWVRRLGVASHARAAADAFAVLPTVVPGPRPSPAADVLLALDDELADAATLVDADLAPGHGHGDRPRAPRVETATRDAAVQAIAACRDEPAPVVRAVLGRDWIIAVAEMVDSRP